MSWIDVNINFIAVAARKGLPYLFEPDYIEVAICWEKFFGGKKKEDVHMHCMHAFYGVPGRCSPCTGWIKAANFAGIPILLLLNQNHQSTLKSSLLFWSAYPGFSTVPRV